MRRKRLLSGSKVPATDSGTYLTRGPHIALALAAFGWCLLAFLTCATFLSSSAPKRVTAADDVSINLVGRFPPSAIDDSTPGAARSYANPASPSGSAPSSRVSTHGWADPAVRPSQDGGSDTVSNVQPPNGPIVRIHHRQGSFAGKEAAMRIAQEVRKAGGHLVSISAEPAVPATRQVRYSSHADAAEANELAQRFKRRWGNAWRLDRSENTPGDRRFEIWLPHR